MGLHVRIHDNIRRGQLCCKDSMIVNRTFTNVTELQSYLFILPVALYFCGDLSIVFLSVTLLTSEFETVISSLLWLTATKVLLGVVGDSKLL